MIRIIFFSDTHLGFDEAVRPRVSRPRRGADFFANFNAVLDYAVKVQADLIVHGGDFFAHSRVHASVVDRAYQALHAVAGLDIPIAIVPGNHERSVMPPSLFLHHPNILLFDQPRTFVLDIRGTRLHLHGFPYVRKVRARFSEIVRSLTKAQPSNALSLLCMHHAVQGARVGPHNFTFSTADDVVRAADLPAEVSLVLSGHIHRRQWLAHATPVLFCGSVERTSFMEAGEKKGFCEILLGDQAGDSRIAFHDLPVRPMLTLDALECRCGEDLMRTAMAHAQRWPAGAIVRVRTHFYPDAALVSALRDRADVLFEFSRPLGR